MALEAATDSDSGFGTGTLDEAGVGELDQQELAAMESGDPVSDNPDESPKAENTAPDTEIPLEYEAINKAFPQLFERSPELASAIQEVEQYRGLFDSPETAQTAAKAVKVLDQFSANLHAGNSSYVLRALAGSDQQAAQAFIDGFLPTVYELSPAAYNRAITPHITAILARALESSNGNEDMQKAVAIVSKALFKSERLPDARIPQPSPENSGKQAAASEKELQYFYNDSSQAVATEVSKLVVEDKSLVGLSPAMRKIVADQSYTKLLENLGASPQYQRTLAQFASMLESQGPSAALRDKVTKNFLRHAAPLLPTIIRSVRAELTGQKTTAAKPTKPVYRQSSPGTKSAGNQKSTDLSTRAGKIAYLMGE